LWCTVMCLVTFTALAAGCRTTQYTAANLPAQLRVQPASPTAGINLDQIVGDGVGTSQIGPGDLVEITIVSGSGEERPLPVPARVTEAGVVMVPLIGSVPIGGLEPVDAEQRIAAAAIERGVYRQPFVTVTVEQPAVNRVTVLGAVTKPGVVELPRGSCDLANALAAAGGLTEEASTRVEILHRGGSTLVAGKDSNGSDARASGVRLAAHEAPSDPAKIPFAAPSPLESQADATNAAGLRQLPSGKTQIDLAQVDRAGPVSRKLADRDVVMVLPEQTPVIHVTGLVHKPNQFELKRGNEIRVLDAIAMAGGVSSPVADRVFVIRQLPDMPEPAVVRVSIARAKRNGSENLVLAAGDLVSVESTASTMTVDTISKFFRVAFGVSGNLATF
jgi:polysaccharide export outer membrane protein